MYASIPDMARTKEKATAAVRIYPKTRRRINILAAKKSTTIAEVIEELSAPKVATK